MGDRVVCGWSGAASRRRVWLDRGQAEFQSSKAASFSWRDRDRVKAVDDAEEAV